MCVYMVGKEKTSMAIDTVTHDSTCLFEFIDLESFKNRFKRVGPFNLQ